MANFRIAGELGANRIKVRFRGLIKRLAKAESPPRRVIALLSPLPFRPLEK